VRRSEMAKGKQFTMRMSQNTHAAIKVLAEREERSVSAMAEKLIKLGIWALTNKGQVAEK
jgi:hypothetical protein